MTSTAIVRRWTPRLWLRGAQIALVAAIVGGCAAAEKPPRLIGTAEPPYPDAARTARQEGYVVVSYLVTADGMVTDLQVVESVPDCVPPGPMLVETVTLRMNAPFACDGRSPRRWSTKAVRFSARRRTTIRSTAGN